tara:strand:- start:358 stop:669 length:312 start_codon:yes stop_codon:yes gene_type:complete
MAKGVDTMNAISDVTSRAYGGLDLVIHCGYAVDLGAISDGVLTLISRAEQERGRSDALNSDRLLCEAFEQLRGAYRLHWGASSARGLMAHQSHIGRYRNIEGL